MKIRSFYLPALVLLMVMFLGTACQKENSDSQQDLYGDWKWQKSVGGIAGTARTPQSTGEQVVLRLSRERNFSVLTNGFQTEEGTFRLYTRQYGSGPTEWPMIEFSNDSTLPIMIHKCTADSLVLSESVADGYTHYFTR